MLQTSQSRTIALGCDSQRYSGNECVAQTSVKNVDQFRTWCWCIGEIKCLCGEFLHNHRKPPPSPAPGRMRYRPSRYTRRTSWTICEPQHPPRGNKRRLMKTQTWSKLRSLYSFVKEIQPRSKFILRKWTLHSQDSNSKINSIEQSANKRNSDIRAQIFSKCLPCMSAYFTSNHLSKMFLLTVVQISTHTV